MKHKHYDCIVAWAEGKKIEVFNDRRMRWEDITGDPYWVDSFQYRIKPMPKPDFCTYSTITFGNIGRQSIIQYGSDNVKFTYDGETRKLKSAEVL